MSYLIVLKTCHLRKTILVLCQVLQICVTNFVSNTPKEIESTHQIIDMHPRVLHKCSSM